MGDKMKNFKKLLTKMWHKLSKKNKKEKGQTVEMLPVLENHKHSMDCTNSLQSRSEQHCTDAFSVCTSSVIKSSQHDRHRADSLGLESLDDLLLATNSLSVAPSLSATSLLEDVFEPPTPVPYERQMSSSVRSLPCLDDNSSFQNLECKQTSGYISSLELISRNRCLSGRCIDINCSTVGHSSYHSSFSCQPDTFDLFMPNQTIEALNLAQPRASHQYNRPCINAVGGGLMETDITETVEESPVCEKSHFGSRKRILNLENDDFIERQNQFDILKSTEVGIYMGQHHKKQKLQAYKLITEKTKEHVDSHLGRRAHSFHQNDGIGKEVFEGEHMYFIRRAGTEKEDIERKHMCSTRMTWIGKEVFKGEHMYSTRRAGTEKEVNMYFTNIFQLTRNVYVIQLFDGKDGVEAWAKEQLFCSTPVLDHKCSRTNSENKKRKKQLNTPRKLLQKNPWETWRTKETEHMFGKKKIVQKQAKDISQRNLRKYPGKLTTEQRYKVQNMFNT